MHVLRERTGEFINSVQVWRGVGEDSGNYPSNIIGGNRRGLAAPER